MMYRPRPPKETTAASVAVATIWIAAARSPARISGSAAGISTCLTSCQGVMPSPRRRPRGRVHGDAGVV